MNILNFDESRIDRSQFQLIKNVIFQLTNARMRFGDVRDDYVTDMRRAVTSRPPGYQIYVTRAVHYALDVYGEYHFDIKIKNPHNQQTSETIHIYVDPINAFHCQVVAQLTDGTVNIQPSTCCDGWIFRDMTLK